MLIEIKVPIPGESITHVILSKILVGNGSIIEKDAEIAEIDSDKATLSITAEVGGKISFLAKEGDVVAVSSIVATVDTDFKQVASITNNLNNDSSTEKPAETKEIIINKEDISEIQVTPLAQRMMEKEDISAHEVDLYLQNRKITKEKVEQYLTDKNSDNIITPKNLRNHDEKKMSPLRQKLAQRLVSVKNETAMLTTFNEIDMSAVMELRKNSNEAFKQKHGVSLGYMSLFSKAVSIALQHFPMVNSQINEDEISTFDYVDISIAVSTPKGLVVPVLRNVEQMKISQIEVSIKEFATKARENKLSLDEMQGGTFTITNGGVFGSLMSTPIINPPQSAILGMHNILERPIALNGQVVIRPMMYVALSYDHRIIDGRDSVGFLKMVKELIENPIQLLTEGKNLMDTLLDL